MSSCGATNAKSKCSHVELTCEHCVGWGEPVFTCGSGLTDAQRADFWARRDELLGQKVKYKHLPHGAKDAPRHPVFLGIRASEDMTT